MRTADDSSGGVCWGGLGDDRRRSVGAAAPRRAWCGRSKLLRCLDVRALRVWSVGREMVARRQREPWAPSVARATKSALYNTPTLRASLPSGPCVPKSEMSSSTAALPSSVPRSRLAVAALGYISATGPADQDVRGARRSRWCRFLVSLGHSALRSCAVHSFSQSLHQLAEGEGGAERCRDGVRGAQSLTALTDLSLCWCQHLSKRLPDRSAAPAAPPSFGRSNQTRRPWAKRSHRPRLVSGFQSARTRRVCAPPRRSQHCYVPLGAL